MLWVESSCTKIIGCAATKGIPSFVVGRHVVGLASGESSVSVADLFGRC